jgi:anti-sigma-K factor RskA
MNDQMSSVGRNAADENRWSVPAVTPATDRPNMWTNPHPSPDDWLALQYVLGELAAPAAEAFEQRLADDVELCRRVAAAVRCLDALVAAETIPLAAPPVAETSRSSRPWSAVAAVAAAAVCLLWTFSPWSRTERDENNRVAAQLVTLWRGHHETLKTTAVSEPDLSDDDAEVAGDQIPAWMIAAVSLERGRQELNPRDDWPRDDWEDN